MVGSALYAMRQGDDKMTNHANLFTFDEHGEIAPIGDWLTISATPEDTPGAMKKVRPPGTFMQTYWAVVKSTFEHGVVFITGSMSDN